MRSGEPLRRLKSGDDEHAGDETRAQDLNVLHRIHEGANEENRNHDVRKGQPIGAVSQPRMYRAALAKTIADS